MGPDIDARVTLGHPKRSVGTTSGIPVMAQSIALAPALSSQPHFAPFWRPFRCLFGPFSARGWCRENTLFAVFQPHLATFWLPVGDTAHGGGHRGTFWSPAGFPGNSGTPLGTSAGAPRPRRPFGQPVLMRVPWHPGPRIYGKMFFWGDGGVKNCFGTVGPFCAFFGPFFDPKNVRFDQNQILVR